MGRVREVRASVLRLAAGIAGVVAMTGAAAVIPAMSAEAVPVVVAADGASAPDPMHPLLQEQNAATLAQWWAPATISASAPPPPPVDPATDTHRAQLLADGVEVSETGWVHPLPQGRFTSAFGHRGAIGGVTSAGLHNGIDIAAPLGYPIRAAAAGTVSFVGLGYAYGNTGYLVAIDHGDGVVTTYNHMAADGIIVTAGQEVREGAIIAVVGNEGRSSGPHLHFAVRVDGTPVDPVPYLLAEGIDLKSGKAVTPVPLTQDWLDAQEELRSRPAPTAPSDDVPALEPEPTEPPVAEEPSRTEPPPTELPPTEPSPTDPPSPTPTPGETPSPDPTEPDPTAPDPTDPDPTGSDPTDPDPSEPDPSEPDPSETPSETTGAPSPSPSSTEPPNAGAAD